MPTVAELLHDKCSLKAFIYTYIHIWPLASFSDPFLPDTSAPRLELALADLGSRTVVLYMSYEKSGGVELLYVDYGKT